MKAIRPTLELIVKSLMAPLTEELIQSAKDASTTVANEKNVVNNPKIAETNAGKQFG